MSTFAFDCPKCNRHGFMWDGRAKILICYYKSCSHVIRIPGQWGIPSVEVIRAAIDADKNGESVGKSVRGVMKSDKQWDDPEFDSTDWAHPAWWRGELHGVHRVMRLVENIVNGKETGVGAMNGGADKLRQMVLGLKWKYDAMCDARVDWIKRSKTLQNDRDSLARSWRRNRTELERERDSLRCDVERLTRELHETKWSVD